MIVIKYLKIMECGIVVEFMRLRIGNCGAVM
jgi:hypothetical protein